MRSRVCRCGACARAECHQRASAHRKRCHQCAPMGGREARGGGGDNGDTGQGRRPVPTTTGAPPPARTCTPIARAGSLTSGARVIREGSAARRRGGGGRAGGGSAVRAARLLGPQCTPWSRPRTWTSDGVQGNRYQGGHGSR